LTDSNKHKRGDIIFSLLIGLSFVIMVKFGLCKNTVNKNLLVDYGVTTEKLIEFHYCNYSYCATYTYTVDQEKFEGHFGSEYFKCPDGTPVFRT
jgi:hypothetical protein